MRLIYKSGTEQEIWGRQVDTKLIEEHELDEHLADGWVMTPADLSEGAHDEENLAEAEDEPGAADYVHSLTIAEVRAKLEELGIDTDGKHHNTLRKELREAMSHDEDRDSTPGA